LSRACAPVRTKKPKPKKNITKGKGRGRGSKGGKGTVATFLAWHSTHVSSWRNPCMSDRVLTAGC
jgi:hypothetical protein